MDSKKLNLVLGLSMTMLFAGLGASVTRCRAEMNKKDKCSELEVRKLELEVEGKRLDIEILKAKNGL